MTCPSGKKSYRNRAAALRGLLACRFNRKGRLRKNSRRQERSAYLCGCCSRWHLTKYPDGEIHIDIDMEKSA